MADLLEDLAVQHEMARAEQPDATPDDLAEVIVRRMSGTQVEQLAAESLGVENGLRESVRAGAVEYVRQFIYSME